VPTRGRPAGSRGGRTTQRKQSREGDERGRGAGGPGAATTARGCDGGEADGPFRASDRGIGGTLASPWREGKSRVAVWTGEIHRRGERQDAHNGQAVSTDGSPREADPLPDCATQSHMTRRLSVNTPHAR
jgi:hypothetical protein